MDLRRSASDRRCGKTQKRWKNLPSNALGSAKIGTLKASKRRSHGRHVFRKENCSTISQGTHVFTQGEPFTDGRKVGFEALDES